MNNLILSVFLCLSCFNVSAQKNSIATNVSTAILGTGDIRSTSLGVDYNYEINRKYYLYTSLRFTHGGSSDLLLSLYDEFPGSTSNFVLLGESGHVENIAIYRSILIGAGININLKKRWMVKLTGGIGHQKIVNNFISAAASVENTMFSRDVLIIETSIVSKSNLAPFTNLEWVYSVNKIISSGLLIHVELGNDTLSSAGIVFRTHF